MDYWVIALSGSDAASRAAHKVVSEISSREIGRVVLDSRAVRIGAKLDDAARSKFTAAIIIGEMTARSGSCELRNIATGAWVLVSLDSVLSAELP